MPDEKIAVFINERKSEIPPHLTLRQLKDKEKPDADVWIVNGFPSSLEYRLKEGDCVAFIKRGEIPRQDELEALMVARHTPGVFKRMKEATVGIAGLGGLGSAVCIALARMGVGRLILVDFDVVEPSNLNRQQYFIEHIGMAKVEAARQILKKVNPYVKVICHETKLDHANILELFGEAGVIIECFDQAEEKAGLIEAAAEQLPMAYVIGASGLAGIGASNDIRTRRLGKTLFIVGDLINAAESGRGLMAPRVGIAAHHQANLAVSLLLDPEKTLKEIPEVFV